QGIKVSPKHNIAIFLLCLTGQKLYNSDKSDTERVKNEHLSLMVIKYMLCVNAPPLISLSFPRPIRAIFDKTRTTVRNATCEKCPDPGFEAVPIVQNINMLFKKSCMGTNDTILYVKPVTISLGCTCAVKIIPQAYF
uniref:Uncharacterized protein n=1 Tax=Sinocyclocheilus rhinocerous TaxID=307959 RepID=A0A673LQ49_9TELE